MKIAVPTKENNQIDNHFGHCAFYTIFIISDENEILAEAIHPSPQGCGCKSNIAYELSEMGVKVMLAGGIGEGAVNVLSLHGIKVVRNCQGEVHNLVEQYLSGNLKDSGKNCTTHQDGHVCSH